MHSWRQVSGVANTIRLFGSDICGWRLAVGNTPSGEESHRETRTTEWSWQSNAWVSIEVRDADHPTRFWWLAGQTPHWSVRKYSFIHIGIWVLPRRCRRCVRDSVGTRPADACLLRRHSIDTGNEQCSQQFPEGLWRWEHARTVFGIWCHSRVPARITVLAVYEVQVCAKFTTSTYCSIENVNVSELNPQFIASCWYDLNHTTGEIYGVFKSYAMTKRNGWSNDLVRQKNDRERMSGPRKAFCLRLSEMHSDICDDHKLVVYFVAGDFLGF